MEVVSGSASDRNDTGNEQGASVPDMEATGARGIEEISPDLLKNTPSNIARLEDVIEQCEGRQKYLAHTRSPSDGGDVRWYFCEVPLADNELAASVPRTEIVGKGDYFRFGMRDSLAIEASFLQKEEELLSCWWKEYAECSEGPKEQPSSSKKLDTQPNESSSEDAQPKQLYEVEEERVGVPVKGGLYEVDLGKRHCFPVYWNGENRRVLRGHWFAQKGGLDWLPLREDVAEQLEIAYRSQVWHRRTFQPSGLFASRVDLQGSTPGLHALFTGEDDTWEAWLNIDTSGFSSIIPGGKGIKLRRGYSTSQSPKPTQDELRQQKEEEMDDYCSQVPVQHLVFMVHGIGQRLEKSNLVDDVANFRHITACLAERHLTSHQRGTQRVLFIPCQWRKGLKLSGETAVEKCTLDGVKGLRVTLSATVHDVLYYMSPIYCQDIINSVSNQLNRLYLKFLKRNPGYNGKVSLYGHSLGSVLSYDILCHQENLSSPFPMMDWMYKEHAKHEKSSPDMNNQTSLKNSSTNLDKPSSLINKTEDRMGPTDNDKRSAETAVLACEGGVSRGNTENTLDNQVDPVVSGFDEFTERAMNSVQEPCGRMAEEVCEDTSDKDKVIKLLRKEIDLLKVKIAEMEPQCGGGDRNRGLHQENKEVQATVPKQPISENLPLEQDDSPKSYTPYIKYTKLEFKVDTFFAVGSPLGVFLALRNIRIGIGKGQEYWEEEKICEEMPACQLMFNIFHPFDPVAYRIEPLVCKECINKRPVIIPYHRGGKRLHIGFQEFTEDLAARSQVVLDHLRAVRVKVLTVCQSGNKDKLEEGPEAAEEKEERSYGSIMMERLTGSTEGRIDHMLQDKTFQHPYISAIGAHTNYWRDSDTALFVLKHLYRDIPEDPNTLQEFGGGDLKNETSSKGWCDQRESIEEELPLTFSDKSMVRNFSSRARKLWKKP
ncbi:hypothetical protein FNV43_RR11884 [Rhamnella rubrinervis]|uniref:DDHD domain-containing protein n=1 Tax=Rhamnella rubrinervis TaxID=2594499 RepID=A0A8K0MHQ6_9ROSA|nr:hypothetical protein FNV43_RR11884 [Rhamnella rubrinervis]